MAHKLLGPKEWEAYPSRDFAAWFSQLEGMRSPVLIGTRSTEGVDNLAVFNSLTHVGARPPLLGFVLRPLTVDRHTYTNIKAAGTYTINHMPASAVHPAHETSGKFHADRSEFDAVGLTSLDSGHGAPYVAEATISMTLDFVEEHHIGANDTLFVVGKVRELRLPKAARFGHDPVDWGKLKGLVVSGLYDYYTVAHHTKLGYVRVVSGEPVDASAS